MPQNAFEMKLTDMLHVCPDELTDAMAIAPEGWDSVDVLDLIAAIDDSFATTVPVQEINRCRNVGELRALIRAAVGA